MPPLEFADWLAVAVGVFGEVADNQIKLFQVISGKRLMPIADYHHLVAQATQNLFEYGTQFIVIIDDENPTFGHPTPIKSLWPRRDERGRARLPKALYDIACRPVQKYIRSNDG